VGWFDLWVVKISLNIFSVERSIWLTLDVEIFIYF